MIPTLSIEFTAKEHVREIQINHDRQHREKRLNPSMPLGYSIFCFFEVPIRSINYV